MADPKELKVFISWSGALSRAVALALREWLPLITDNVKPWASEADIEAGDRGLPAIEKELSGTSFGIIVVTQANKAAEWLNFEAGALSRVVSTDTKNRVVPLLVDISGPAQLTGPLKQFQAKTLTKDGMKAVLSSIASVAGLPESSIDARFEAFWPKLEKLVDDAKKHEEVATDFNPRDPNEMIEETLTIVRAIQGEAERSRQAANLWSHYRSGAAGGGTVGRAWPTFGETSRLLFTRDQLVTANFDTVLEHLTEASTATGVTIQSVEPSRTDDDHQFVATINSPVTDDELEQFQNVVAQTYGIAVLAVRPETD